MDDAEFKDKLRALCIAYDNENGAFPDTQYEGLSLYEFFMEVGVVDMPEFVGTSLEDAWNGSDEWRAAGRKT